MPAPLNITGAWAADDGAVYYIRHLSDGSIWWAGLHNSGFHFGLRFTNVFRGVANPGNRTIEGSWVDVPRGSGILQQGHLSLDIVETTPSDDDVPPPPPGVPRGGEPHVHTLRGRGTPRIELKQMPDSTTGEFGGRAWTRWFQLDPQDINNLADRVRRIDSSLLENNPPYKDFAVVFGTIGEEGAKLSWNPNVRAPRDYCTFIRDEGDGDGDITFHVNLSPRDRQELDTQPDFWSSRWLRTVSDIRAKLDSPRLSDNRPNNSFHAEVIMYGRENDEDHCAGSPSVLLPGWMETAGNSVLLNGESINGNTVAATVAVPPGAPPVPPTIGFRLVDPDRVVALLPGCRVRISGVIAVDPDHDDDQDPGLLVHRAEIHPVYAIDLLQDFSQPRQGADLTGVWHANDVETYYLRQIGGNTLWWLGLSQDQGRTFANVFHGTIQGDTVNGEWADIPAATGGARSSGHLTLVGDGSGQLTTSLTATEKTGGFGGSAWRKLYDRPMR